MQFCYIDVAIFAMYMLQFLPCIWYSFAMQMMQFCYVDDAVFYVDDQLFIFLLLYNLLDSAIFSYHLVRFIISTIFVVIGSFFNCQDEC